MSARDFLTYFGIYEMVDDMRKAGVSDTRIACWLTTVRSAAIAEERMRIAEINRIAEPFHYSWAEMLYALKGCEK